MKNFIKENWFKMFLVIAIIYVIGMYSYQEFRPKTNREQAEECLKLQNEFAIKICIDSLIIAEERDNAKITSSTMQNN